MLDEKNDNLPNEADGQEETQPTQESTATAATTSEEATNTQPIAVEEDEAHKEIDESNAEDAEDEDNSTRHSIPMADYHEMSLESLAAELEKLVTNNKVQAIKQHVEAIKSEFLPKYNALLEEKKEEFVANGGNEIDFYYQVPAKTQFDAVYGLYKEKRNSYYKNLEQSLNDNLAKRLHIIEELKGLINVEENINTTYKHFKELQESWRNAGPIPRGNYNDVWRNYHFHTEMFYDFLDLNRDLRDLDFKHNLEEKLKIIDKAESLAQESDVMKAFRELQVLHKVWKEDLGPVDREHREAIWEKFSNATKTIHNRRQSYFDNIEQVYEQNLEKKQEITAAIEALASKKVSSHRDWQNLIKQVDTLRDEFFKAGKVPAKVNEETWDNFKASVRSFNRNKNNFYKSLKKEQQDNLDKKLELIEIAEANKNNEDFDVTTPLMKKIQNDWKKVGHVPRKYSDKIWIQFKNACNHYFNRLHEQRNESMKEEFEALDQKKAILDQLKDYQLSGEHAEDIKKVKEFITTWKAIGRVPFSKKSVETKFNKIIDALFRKLDMDKQQADLIKYGNRIDQLANEEDEYKLNNEHIFIRKKIDEVKAEIRQLENNMQFFTNVDESNPLVKDVIKNINKHKDALEVWKEKLKAIKTIKAEVAQHQEEQQDEDTTEEE